MFSAAVRDGVLTVARIEDISAEDERELEMAALAAARDRPPQPRQQPFQSQPNPSSLGAATGASLQLPPQPQSQTQSQGQAQDPTPGNQSNLTATHPHPMQLPPSPSPGTGHGPVQTSIPSLNLGPNSGPNPSGIPLEETAHTTEDYMNICRSFIEQLRSGSAPWLLQRLNNTYGTMPDDPSEFSYWMALVRPNYSHPYIPPSGG